MDAIAMISTTTEATGTKEAQSVALDTTPSPAVAKDGAVAVAEPLPLPVAVGPRLFDGALAAILAGTPCSLLRPFAFFTSWSGVLTLAYQGFPPALKRAKHDINSSIRSLASENPGSRWPKTSLGCLKEGARLTPQQLDRLSAICTQRSGAFQQPQSRRSQAVLVDQLEVVIYECRCLERQISKHVIPLEPRLDSSEPPADEKARVQDIVAEADAPDYWYHASRDGNRESHYRSTALGVTLVHELSPFTGRQQPAHLVQPRRSTTPDLQTPNASLGHAAHGDQHELPGGGEVQRYGHALPGIIRSFRNHVDRELPGMYTWFDDSSLHITIRAVI